VNVTGWASGLEVTGEGTGIVSHAGLGLLRRLADKTGLTDGLSRALASGRVLADLACVIADGGLGISDFRVLADQREAFGQAASVPTAYRTLEGDRPGLAADAGLSRMSAGINQTRRCAERGRDTCAT
jgi:hypothetical protein